MMIFRYFGIFFRLINRIFNLTIHSTMKQAKHLNELSNNFNTSILMKYWIRNITSLFFFLDFEIVFCFLNTNYAVSPFLSMFVCFTDLLSFAFMNVVILVFRRTWLKCWAVTRPLTNSTPLSMTKLKYLKPVPTRVNKTKNRFSNQDSSRKRRLKIFVIKFMYFDSVIFNFFRESTLIYKY